MNKELIEKIIIYNYNEYGAEFGDALVYLKQENEWLHHIIKEVREYITSYESISTIQGLEDIEANKNLDEKTLNEIVRRYMIVHDKLLKILDKGE